MPTISIIVAKAISDIHGGKVDVWTNAVPKVWAMEDSYCQLIPCDDPNNEGYVMIPRIGAFEVTYKGILVFSKLLSQMWPHVPSVAKRICQMLQDNSNGRSIDQLR